MQNHKINQQLLNDSAASDAVEDAAYAAADIAFAAKYATTGDTNAAHVASCVAFSAAMY